MKRHWLAICASIAIVCMVFTWGVYVWQSLKTQEASVYYTEKEMDEQEKKDEAEDNYSDNIFQLSTSVLVAIETISITIFIFLKSLLDRNSDERSYSKKVMGSYNEQMSKILEILTIDGILLVVYGFIFYSSRFFRFKFEYFHRISGWLVPNSIYIGCSIVFWYKCININKVWRKIAEESLIEEEMQIRKLIAPGEISSLIKEISNSTTEIEWKRYTQWFTKLEEFLLLGIDTHYNIYTDGDEQIKDRLLQDDQNKILGLNDIEEADLKEENIFDKVNQMRKRLEKVDTILPELYQRLENCRDYLLVKTFYTGNTPQEETDETVQNALKLFYQKILIEKFRNLVIEGIIFENPVFTYVDLYGARVENSILTGAWFKNAVLARLQIQNTNLTLGCYDNSILKHVRVDNSSFLSSKFLYTDIRNSKFIDVECSNSSLCKGRIENSAFLNSNLSDTEFKDIKISNVDFTDTILQNVEFKGCTSIEDCSFVRAQISQWKIQPNMLKPFQNFTEAVLTGFQLGDANTTIDASGDVFKDAVIYEGKFKNLIMKDCIFQGSNMARIEMENVFAEASDMREVNLFGAEIRGDFPPVSSVSSFCNCDLTNATAVKAKIINTDFKSAVCTAMDLSETYIHGGNWNKAKMERVVLSNAKIFKVSFEKANFAEAVIENTQFVECIFRGAVFDHASISGAKFKKCVFSDLKFEKIRGSGFEIEDCIIN